MVHLQTSPLLLLHRTAFPQLLEKNLHGSHGPAVHTPWGPVLALEVPKAALFTSKNILLQKLPCQSGSIFYEEQTYASSPDRATVGLFTGPDPTWSRCPKPAHRPPSRQPSRGSTTLWKQLSNRQLRRAVQLQATELRCLGLSW